MRRKRRHPSVLPTRYRLCAGCNQTLDVDFDAHDVWSDDLRDLQWFCEDCCPKCQAEDDDE